MLKGLPSLLNTQESRCLEDASASDDSDNSILPSQAPSITPRITELTFPFCGHSINVKLAVDAGPGCGGIAWPAGRVLANYLLRRKTLAGLNIVELGSGTGLVGIVAGMMQAQRVWITDQAPLLDLMKTNVALNGLKANVQVVCLDWGSTLPTTIPHEPDIVLAADCVYFEPAFPLLVQTLSALAISPKTEILFCYKKRRKADKKFFALLKKVFGWTEVVDDPQHEEYTRDSIFLYRLIKKHKHQ